MPLLEWNDSLSVDVAAMDAEHERLIDLVNNLNEAMKQGRTRNEMERVFDELARYLQTHFASEERFMARIGYPDLEAHRREHVELMRTVSEFRRDYDAGKVLISVRLMGFLRDWLRNHLQTTDTKYGVWAGEHAHA